MNQLRDLRYGVRILTRNPTLAVFAVGVSLLCSLLFGLVPAWQATKRGVADMIKEDPASSPRSVPMGAAL